LTRTLLTGLFCLISALAWGQSSQLEQTPSAPRAEGADSLDQVLSRWERTQRDMRSLVVEFTLVKPDKVFGTTDKSDGVFRLLRTPDGEVRASYERTPRKPNDASLKLAAGLLNRRTIYLVDFNQKQEFRLNLGQTDLVEFLEDYFNPLSTLLDRKRAEENYAMDIARDKTYTYLNIKPKASDRPRGWFFPISMTAGRIALRNADSKEIPKDMPRQIWFQSGSQEFFYEIKSWRINAADGPTVDEFARAKNPPGWKLLESDWPLDAPRAK
jgi:hypothetical protein